MLKTRHSENLIEAGCDEAGRGPLAGPVFAAAVILPSDWNHELLDDSKKMTEKNRYLLRDMIEKEAVDWAVGMVMPEEIDRINILNASILAMNKAVRQLKTQPEFLLVDGNRFKTDTGIPYACIVKGDGIYTSIAAASVLAKTYRDDYMKKLALEYPAYGWDRNKGYPTREHREAVLANGLTAYHRKSFCGFYQQLTLFS